MPESDELYTSIGLIKHKVESIDKGMTILLRINGKQMTAEYIDILTKTPMLCQVYLNIDGQQTQQQIANSVGCSDASVHRRIKELVDLDLIELSHVNDSGKVYKYTRMESLFKLSSIIRKTKDEK